MSDIFENAGLLKSLLPIFLMMGILTVRLAQTMGGPLTLTSASLVVGKVQRVELMVHGMTQSGDSLFRCSM